MLDKPHALRSLSLEVEGNKLRAVLLSIAKKIVSIERVLEIDLPVQEIGADHVNANNLRNWDLNPLHATEEGQRLRYLIKQHLTVTTLMSDEVLVRALEIKLKKERDIEAALPFQVEPLLPYPIENALLDKIKIGQTSDSTLLTVIAARKEIVKRHLDFWKSRLEMEPEVVSAVPVALAAFSRSFCPTMQKPHFVVHLGKEQTACVLVREGKLIASQSSMLGLDLLIHAEAQETQSSYVNGYASLLRTSFGTLSQKDRPLLHTTLENWRLEITRLLYAIGKQNKEGPVQDILFTGEGALFTELCVLYASQLKKETLLCTAPVGCTLPISQLQRLAIPIGGALSVLPNFPDSINFRQQEFAYPAPWKWLKKPFGIYFGCCLFTACALYFYGVVDRRHQENAMKQEYVTLLGVMNKSHATVESDYVKKSPGEESVLEVQQLTPRQIQNRLFYLNKEMKENPDLFPLQANIPRVSDVLAWLSTHPQVTAAVQQEIPVSPLQIDNFTYTVVKRPELKKPYERYQVKVEMEFSSPTAKLAREFHDALIAPNDLVDPKAEVKWSSNRGKYRTSFYLKDRTTYIPSSSKGGG